MLKFDGCCKRAMKMSYIFDFVAMSSEDIKFHYFILSLVF